jgi:hypothetical protein
MLGQSEIKFESTLNVTKAIGDKFHAREVRA